MKNLLLKYYSPAPDSMDGWEKYSLPIGNGYFGASLFGRTDSERIQFTTNTFANTGELGGVSNFAEIRLDFAHEEVTAYERGLCLLDGCAYTQYTVKDNRFESRAFYSYPDKVFVYKLKTSQKAAFSARLVIPYLGARAIEEGGRTGEVFTEDNCLIMRSALPLRELVAEGRLYAVSDGQVRVEGQKLLISDATETVLYFVADTSYQLDEKVFLDGCHKAIGADPSARVQAILNDAISLGCDQLFRRHQEDYCGLMSRVDFDLGSKEDGRSTEELLESCKKGNFEPYLEELYYQYGRHLLVSSSRKGTPPASLQGVWSAYDKSPWGSGFWHNINVQMNYWPAFSTNLAETFTAYADFNKAFRKQAERLASQWIQENIPENYVEGQGECGWLIGVASYCYEIEGMCRHSGPGTGGLTTQLFWDYYDYTRDENILKEVTFPAIHGMSKFLTKCVRNFDGEYLAAYSASPEQIIGGVWISELKSNQPYYHTVGCAFDQQMLYENAKNDLHCAELLGFTDDVVELEKKQISAYAPVLIGDSGQIKEYREENFYGEIGEWKHRHISQLVGLSPGTTIHDKTPAWIDAAKRTLLFRGDESTGWALAHRLCAWAKTGDGDHAYLLLQNLLKTRTHPNLWDVHPPFQIDGNFGAISGMTDMLLQSYDGCIHLLPALPQAWKNLSFSGLKGRGNFTLSGLVREGKMQRVKITAVKGGEVWLVCRGIHTAKVVDAQGKLVSTFKKGQGILFSTKAGESYRIDNFDEEELCQAPYNVKGAREENGVLLTWEGNEEKYAVYRAVNSEREYHLLGYTEKTQFLDAEYALPKKELLSYRVTAFSKKNTRESLPSSVFVGNGKI